MSVQKLINGIVIISNPYKGTINIWELIKLYNKVSAAIKRHGFKLVGQLTIPPSHKMEAIR